MEQTELSKLMAAIIRSTAISPLLQGHNYNAVAGLEVYILETTRCNKVNQLSTSCITFFVDLRTWYCVSRTESGRVHTEYSFVL